MTWFLRVFSGLCVLISLGLACLLAAPFLFPQQTPAVWTVMRGAFVPVVVVSLGSLFIAWVFWTLADWRDEQRRTRPRP